MQHSQRTFSLSARGELVAELFSPHRQRLPYYEVHQNDDQEQREQPQRHLAVAAAIGGLHQEAAQARQPIGRGTGGYDFAGDEEVPSRDPGQDRVIDQLGHACGEREFAKAQPSAGTEGLQHFARIVGNRPHGFEHAQREVPRLAGENQEHRRHLDSETAAVRERDEEVDRGGKKSHYRHRLRDVDRRDHHPLPHSPARRRHSIRDREEQRERIRSEHPVERAQRVVGKMARRDAQLRPVQDRHVVPEAEEQREQRRHDKNRGRSTQNPPRLGCLLHRQRQASQHNVPPRGLKHRKH